MSGDSAFGEKRVVLRCALEGETPRPSEGSGVKGEQCRCPRAVDSSAALRISKVLGTCVKPALRWSPCTCSAPAFLTSGKAPLSPTHASQKLGTLLSLGTPGGPGWVRAALEEDGPSGLCKADRVFRPSMMNISDISNWRKNPLLLLI